MKKNKGFTLVELLAVISILAIIMLIIVPIMNNVLKNAAEKSNVDSTLSLVKSADTYYAEHAFDSDFQTGTDILGSLDVKGKMPDEGTVTINDDGKVQVCVIFDEVAYYKAYDSTDVEKQYDPSYCDSIPTE